MPTALITGITGQDGSYLAELLLEKGYTVIGLVRRTSTVNFARIGHIQDDLTLISGDLLDQTSITQVIDVHRPDEVLPGEEKQAGRGGERQHQIKGHPHYVRRQQHRNRKGARQAAETVTGELA